MGGAGAAAEQTQNEWARGVGGWSAGAGAGAEQTQGGGLAKRVVVVRERGGGGGKAKTCECASTLDAAFCPQRVFVCICERVSGHHMGLDMF